MSAKKSASSKSLLAPVGEGWSFTRIPPEEAETQVRETRSGASARERDLLEEMLSTGNFEALERGELQGGSGRRGTEAAAGSTVQLAAEVPEGAPVLLMVRQGSGAISFHRPVAAGVRRGSGGTSRVIFDVPLAEGDSGTGRRGWISKIVRVVLVKVADALVGALVEHAGEWLVPKLARALENKLWENRTQGWLRVDPADLTASEDKMKAGLPAFASNERGLLLVHGTFSSCHGGFRALAKGRFFDGARALYGGNIFAFNHHTISKTPEENVKDLLDALPEGEFEFDIITHSRGGLVARELLEGSGLDHPKRSRLKIGRVILVASPSEGTPLAGESHWENKLSFWANLIEMLPDNPFCTAAGWLAEALQWVAANVLGNCPGLIAMDPAGGFITRIQDPPDEPPGTRYHVITSNFEPPREWLPRLGDMAVDRFFGQANDLVVPCEGSWKNSESPVAWVPGERIACFGPGGNVISDSAVHHGNYFSNPATVEFLLSTLNGAETGLMPMNPADMLPTTGIRNNRGLRGSLSESKASSATTASAVNGGNSNESIVNKTGWDNEEILWLTVISSVEHVTEEDQKAEKSVPMLLATYGSARVTVPFYTSGLTDNAGKRWQRLIAMKNFLVAYANGDENKPRGANKPSPVDELRKVVGAREFNSYFSIGRPHPSATFLNAIGTELFRTLFPGEVRNLYNIARFQHNKRALKIVFTSMIPWVADIPWELAYDASSDCFLACGDVRFIRNVLTPTPANRITAKDGRLRILVVSAQPAGLGKLSIEEETEAIKESFRPLVDAGLVEVRVLAGATPSGLQECLRHPGIGDFDVLHFIGHGEFNEANATGYLIFEDEAGGATKLSATSFLNIVRGRNIRVVFLNACETGRGERADYNRGVAMALARDGIPAVVANQYSVIDRSASLFSLHFYACLAQGIPIGDAMRESRIAIQYCGVEPMDWGVPVLFTSCPDAKLCESKTVAASERGGTQPFAGVLSRRSGGPRRGDALLRKKVMIWDAESTGGNRAALASLVEQMNAAQDAFLFQFEYFGSPGNLWTPDKNRNYGGVAYLRGEKVIGRMDRIRERLGYDFLFCVTAQPLRDENTTELYFYVYPESDPGVHAKVGIFSTWDLKPALEGMLLKRAIATHVGLALLTTFADVWDGGESSDDPNHPIHTVGYFNDERSVDHIAGRMTILPPTRENIRASIAEGIFTRQEFNAVEALLVLNQEPTRTKQSNFPANRKHKTTKR